MQITINDVTYRAEFQHYRLCPTDIAAAHALATIMSADPKLVTEGENAILTASKHLLMIYRRASWDRRITSRHHGVVYRRYMRKRSKWIPAPCGGVTRCALIQDGRMAACAESECSPNDHYSYSIGGAIALQRAIANLMHWERAGGDDEVATWEFVHSRLESVIPVETLNQWEMRGYDPVYAVEVKL